MSRTRTINARSSPSESKSKSESIKTRKQTESHPTLPWIRCDSLIWTLLKILSHLFSGFSFKLHVNTHERPTVLTVISDVRKSGIEIPIVCVHNRALRLKETMIKYIFKNGISVVRRCHKFYGNGLPLTLVISLTFRLMLLSLMFTLMKA